MHILGFEYRNRMCLPPASHICNTIVFVPKQKQMSHLGRDVEFFVGIAENGLKYQAAWKVDVKEMGYK